MNPSTRIIRAALLAVAAVLLAADAGLKVPPSFRLSVRPQEVTAKP